MNPTMVKVFVALMKLTGRFSTRLSGALADTLWFSPWRLPLSERAVAKQARWLAGTEPFTIGSGRNAIAGFTKGDGPAVLLVHGWGERGASLGAFVQPLVDAGYKVIGVDLPAHGGSSGRTTNAYEISELIHDLSRRHGGLYGLVAHSMGGHSSLVALAWGLRVQRLVLLAPNVNMESALTKFRAIFGLSDRTVTGLIRSIQRRFGPDVFERLRAESLVAHVAVPALVIMDRDDDQVDLADVQALVDRWPSARLQVVEGLSHTKIVRDPDVVAAAVAHLDPISVASAQRYARV